MKRKSFQSIKDFKNDIDKIEVLIKGLSFRIEFFAKAQGSIQFKHVDWETFLKSHDFLGQFDEQKRDDIFELGFIRLFASFESFMYELMKELYKKYPKSMPKDRKINIDDVLEWKTGKSIREYILDHIAIENSYDLIVWEKTLKNSFGIDAFEDTKQKKEIELLNICRNMSMHSGGKFNSKIERASRRFLSTYENKKEEDKKSLFEVSKMEISYENLFYSSLSTLRKLALHLESVKN